MSITNQLFSFAVIFGTYRVSTVFINRLRHQSQVSHHRNTRADDTFHRIDDFFSAFQFQSIGMAFLHNADGRSKTFHFVTLIGTERHVYYDHSAFYATYYWFSVINHLIESNRQCSHITRHHVRSGVAYQNYVHSRTIYDLCHCVIIRSKHRYSFASLLHFNQAMSSHLSCVIWYITSHVS